MANLSLVFDILARDNASPAFRNVGNAAEQAGQQGTGFGSKMSAGIKLAAGALLGAGLIEGFKSLYDAAAESAKIGALTTQVIKTTGGAAGVTAKQVGDLVTAISNKTGVDDEAIQTGSNLLLTFTNVRNEVGKGNDIFSQATSIMTDMSVALGTDASGSAIQLGKALNDPIKGVTALQKVGVSFTESQKDQIKTLVESGNVMGAQKIILGELSKEFGGAAEAAATPFDKLQVQLGNLAEQVGAYLIPVVSDFADFLMHDVLPTASKLGDTFGGIIGPALHAVGDGFKFIYEVVSGAVKVFADLPGPVLAGVGALGAFLLLRGPLTAMIIQMTYLPSLIAGAGGAAAVAKAGFSGLLGVFGGGWGLAITAVTVGLGFLVQWLGKSGDATGESAQRTEAAAQSQKDFAAALRESNGAITENVRHAAAKAAQDAGLLDSAAKAGAATSDVTDALLGNDAAYQRVSNSLAAYAEVERLLAAGGGAAAEQHLANARAAEQQGTALAGLAGQLPDTIAKQNQLNEATGESVGVAGTATLAQQQFQQGLQDTADAASDAKNATDLFKTSLDVLTGAAVDITGVESEFWAALDEAKTALDNSTGSVLDQTGALDLHSEAGRKTRDTLVGLADDANSWISTMIQQGATTADVTAKDQELRNNFYNTALQMTHNKDAAQRLTDQYYGIPTNRTTTIIADTSQAQSTIDSFLKGITSQGLIGLIRTVGGKKDGGYIAGPGTGRSDSILSFLSNGEFVMNAAATAKHRPLLESLNSAPRFADGGYIGYPSSADFLARTEMTANSKAALEKAFAGLPGPGGAVERWAGLVTQVLGLLGQPGSLVGAVLQLIKHESGGNPNAINLTDSNAKAGHPSQGLMQTIPSTFNAYAGPYKSLGITNPLANIYAGLNYGIHRYGSVMNIPGIKSLAAGGAYKPYDSGGLLMPGLTLAYNGTGKAETVRTHEQEAALGGRGSFVLQLDGPATVDLLEGRAVSVMADAMTARSDRIAFSA